jgi:hypothetical protein
MVEGHVPQGVRVQVPPSALRKNPDSIGVFVFLKPKPEYARRLVQDLAQELAGAIFLWIAEEIVGR